MTKEKSPLNFDKTIAGFNVTEHGVKSYTKSIKLGPFQVTLNARGSGVHGSISIPGTGCHAETSSFSENWASVLAVHTAQKEAV
jgi:hypothetical protein